MRMRELAGYPSFWGRVVAAPPRLNQKILVHISSSHVSMLMKLFLYAEHSSGRVGTLQQMIFEISSDCITSLWPSTCFSWCSGGIYRMAFPSRIGLQFVAWRRFRALICQHGRLIISHMNDTCWGSRWIRYYHELRYVDQSCHQIAMYTWIVFPGRMFVRPCVVLPYWCSNKLPRVSIVMTPAP